MSGERQRRIKRALAAVFGAAAVLVVLYILRPPCLVRKVFGVLCPSCGTTRMIAALLQLDFAGAWALNPFMLLFLPFALLWGVLEAVRYAKGKPPLLFSAFPLARGRRGSSRRSFSAYGATSLNFLDKATLRV